MDHAEAVDQEEDLAAAVASEEALAAVDLAAVTEADTEGLADLIFTVDGIIDPIEEDIIMAEDSSAASLP